jgi:hypothetical protein
MSTALTGNAGAYFVAARLSALDLICAPTFRNVPGVDLLVSDPKGATFVSLQVKTSMSAMRERGRGDQKKPDRYEWAMNWASARQNEANLFFAFVDLKGFQELPDVFIVPSSVVAKYYEGGDPEKWRWPRYHELVGNLEPYKNNFDQILLHLGIEIE